MLDYPSIPSMFDRKGCTESYMLCGPNMRYLWTLALLHRSSRDETGALPTNGYRGVSKVTPIKDENVLCKSVNGVIMAALDTITR